LRTRLPLRSLTVAGPGTADLAPLRPLLADEVNVKSVELAEDMAAYGRLQLRPVTRVLGPRLGGATQDVVRAAKAGEWERHDDGTVTVAGQRLEPDEFELVLVPSDTGGATAALRDQSAVIHLDTDVTEDLEHEGYARDLVRLVQQARKDADLVVTERIVLTVQAGERLTAALDPHLDWISGEVLAAAASLGPIAGDHRAEGRIDGEQVVIAFDRLVEH
jgi:isoleucyl-tRNA synthetase